ncbi:uncharacterized protein LOC113558777 isoform X1 [Rhopalosiphum maidis]|uniref:uncharacterized protein LOC113558777 isoform X1 n=1 Tax=Rhopalosiphum maidis TaxID=43146 RepID=UPI000EFF0F93|nr:uncharacterized protein LOC113558777 isoform X1 [Rhopalosiphum maidis]XP_026820114.1 uncharacterized protein LOC113558777 isoform X1 [Rhopalosiphum maidis]
MARCSTLAVAIIALALCLHTILAYPTSIERVSGDNNYLPLRNSPSRDLDRFIEKFCDDGDNECKIPSDMIAAAVGVTLDRLNGGHAMMTKRSSLDRLNRGHVLVAKRGSLDRLNSGHVMVAKRDSLDRLNGGHVMVAKRDSLDRLNGGHVMAAKRDSLDRLNGGHVMVAKRSHPDWFNGGLTAVVTGGSLSRRGQLQSAPGQTQQQPSKSPLTLNRWSETDDAQYDSDDDRDAYDSKAGDYVRDDEADDGSCPSCGSSAEASSF